MCRVANRVSGSQPSPHADIICRRQFPPSRRRHIADRTLCHGDEALKEPVVGWSNTTQGIDMKKHIGIAAAFAGGLACGVAVSLAHAQAGSYAERADMFAAAALSGILAASEDPLALPDEALQEIIDESYHIGRKFAGTVD